MKAEKTMRGSMLALCAHLAVATACATMAGGTAAFAADLDAATTRKVASKPADAPNKAGDLKAAFAAGRAYQATIDREIAKGAAPRRDEPVRDASASREPIPFALYGEGCRPGGDGITHAPPPTPDAVWIPNGPGPDQGCWRVPNL